MHNFQHVIPPMRIFGGDDSLRSLDRELKRLGCSRVAIVCGGTLSRSGALIGKVVSAVGDRLAGTFAGVKPHSPVPDVQAAAQFLREVEADGVLAVGGGSAIVTARAASILLAEGDDAAALATRIGDDGRMISPRLDAAKLPHFIVPTTPTSASVKAGSAVFDPVGRRRLALFDPKTRAQSVFLDPDMLASVPSALLVNAGINGFTTGLEGMLSTTGNPIADGQLMHSLRLFNQALAKDLAEDDPARGDLAVAAMLCGQGTDHTGAGIAVVLGHAIGARADVDNGIVNAVVLSHALRFNGDAAPEGLRKVAEALGHGPVAAADAARLVLESVDRLIASLDCPTRLRDIGVDRDDLDAIAAAAMGDWFLRGNPRPVRDKGDLLELLEAAW